MASIRLLAPPIYNIELDMNSTPEVEFLAGSGPELVFCGSLPLIAVAGGMPLLVKSIPEFMYGRSKICLFFPGREAEVLVKLIHLLKTGVCLLDGMKTCSDIANLLEEYGGMGSPKLNEMKNKVSPGAIDCKEDPEAKVVKHGKDFENEVKKKKSSNVRVKLQMPEKPKNICFECNKEFKYPSLLQNHLALSHGEYTRLLKYIQVCTFIFYSSFS